MTEESIAVYMQLFDADTSSKPEEPTAAVHKYDTRQSKLFYVKKANTTHRLLSITVRGIHVWNGLESNIRQLPSLQQFKKSLKSTLLSSYL